MIERLEQLLAERQQHVDSTAQMFEKMALEADKSQQERIPQAPADNDDDEEGGDQLKHIVNTQAPEKVYVNSYERVIRKAETKAQKKFLPHKYVHCYVSLN